MISTETYSCEYHEEFIQSVKTNLICRSVMASNPYGLVRLLEVRVPGGWASIYNAEHEIHGAIIAKVYDVASFEEVTVLIREIFLQAKFSHQNVCNILDVCCAPSKGSAFQLVLSLERLEQDLQKAIEDRKNPPRKYSEAEVWDFLQVTTNALYEAQRMVFPI